MWKGWITVITGAWLILSGLVIAIQTPLNLVICGIIITVMGFASLKSWHGFAAGIVGLWVIISGTLLSLWVPTNFILSGTVVLVLGGFMIAYSVDVDHPKEHV